MLDLETGQEVVKSLSHIVRIRPGIKIIAIEYKHIQKRSKNRRINMRKTDNETNWIRGIYDGCLHNEFKDLNYENILVRRVEILSPNFFKKTGILSIYVEKILGTGIRLITPKTTSLHWYIFTPKNLEIYSEKQNLLTLEQEIKRFENNTKPTFNPSVPF